MAYVEKPHLTEDVTNTKGYQWTDFKLRKELLMGIVNKHFDNPSPIQEEVIPLILDRQSVIARAKNGTGKTGSFLIPIINCIDESLPDVQALILVPTRELALQTSAVIKELAKYLKIQCMVSTGGTQLREDIMRLDKTVHIVVATPGRILDLANKNIARLNRCRFFVLDEADKLISQDFQPIILKIMGFLPKDHQVLLFSATFPQNVAGFVRMIPNIRKVNLMTNLTLKGVTQYYAFLEEKEKVACISALFSRLKIQQAIIFCNSALRVELLARKIIQMNFSCYYIHAKMQQHERNKVFHNFRKGQGRCLVSSDLFTRGIDIPTINVVINFDFPSTAETYLHRVGRSGRFGHLGLAINFITEKDKEDLIRIEKELDTDIAPIPQNIDESLY
jgi:ATP-dependent RNA helicase DDX6/DHH1